MPFAAFPTISLPLVFTIGAVGLLGTPWLIRFPRLAVSALLYSLVLGQAIRFPLPGQGGGVLISDIAVVCALLAALVRVFQKRTFSHASTSGITRAFRGEILQSCSFLVLAPFLLWSLLGLVIHSPQLGVAETGIASAYWLRLATHLLLLPALIILFQDSGIYMYTRRSFLIVVGLLVFAGFLQLVFIPDLSGNGGWDPHQGRLFSTWLDPNLFGGFLIMTMPYVAITAFRQKTKLLRGITAFLLFTMLCALVLTQSRSSLIAGAIVLGAFSTLIVTYLISKQSTARVITALALSTMIIIGGVITVFIMRERLYGLLTTDATVTLRAEALKNVWKLAEEPTVLGVGYNAYQASALREGLIRDGVIHSRSGADNSVLTLWVTTGLPGVVLFMVPWALTIILLVRRWLVYQHTHALAGAMGIVALSIHAQFVNSFLYAHLLITVAVMVALALVLSNVPQEKATS